jgi:hypothetical protein
MNSSQVKHIVVTLLIVFVGIWLANNISAIGSVTGQK